MKNKYLQYLEDEAVYIIREAIAEFDNPVFLYSVGKDSSVLLHLLLKATYPEKPKFPLLHVDTGWKFKEMIEFRDKTIKKYGLDIIIHQNAEGVKNNVNPIDYDSDSYTKIMKTDALKEALNKYKFNAAFGGARRDEEKSRAKERIFSFRNKFHSWDIKNQRPELFNIFNNKIKAGESVRVFPLSNWTELDIWRYIKQEEIEIVPLYFAKERPYIEQSGNIIMADDERLTSKKKHDIKNAKIRFRTLGCYPLTSGGLSEADNLDSIIEELEKSKYSERAGRLIDHDNASSMEKKKLDGYF